MERRLQSLVVTLVLLSGRALDAHGVAAKEGREASAAEIQRVTRALCAESMRGRSMAQSGGAEAAAWFAGEFARLGLEPLTPRAGFLELIGVQAYSVAPRSRVELDVECLVLGRAFVPSPFDIARGESVRMALPSAKTGR